MAIGNNNEIEKRLWDAADQLRANSELTAQQYSVPVLGLIFLRYADHKFTVAEKEIAKKQPSGSRRKIGKADYQARGVMFLPDEAHYSYLLNLPERANTGKAINDAMKAIEDENEELKGVLPRTYTRFENDVLVALLKLFSSIQMDIEGDVFGKIYEYFLGKFAASEGKKGGEFFTPISIVKLIVDVNVVTIKEIKEHGYSLNPGRYVGVAEKEEEGFDFYERLEELNEELEQLNTEAGDLEERIADNVEKMLER